MIYRRFFDVSPWRFRNPLAELHRIRQQMEPLYGSTPHPYQPASAGVFPLIDLTEDKDNYYIRAELPGVKGNELDIQIKENSLIISGERKIAAEEEGTRYHRREREAGTFSRMIGLPGDINPDDVAAKLENGILTVEVAKAEAAKPKQITVTS
jgi:HSP20 family protein